MEEATLTEGNDSTIKTNNIHKVNLLRQPSTEDMPSLKAHALVTEVVHPKDEVGTQSDPPLCVKFPQSE